MNQLNKKSATYLKYGDGTFLVGRQTTDGVEFGGLKGTATFGATVRQSASANPNYLDGILGLAYKALDPIDGSDVIGCLGVDIFSTCFSVDGGLMVLNFPTFKSFLNFILFS